MNKFIKQNSVLLFIAIFQVVCFFQVASFIHFHHIHNEDGYQIVVSIHPFDHHSPNHNDHHSEDHHHPSDEHHQINLSFVKSSLNKVHALSAGFYFQSTVVTLIRPGFTNNIPRFDYYVPSKRIISSSIFSRSPPNFSC